MKNTGLKKILNDKIREKGYISVDEMELICKQNNKKISNGERRLRKSDSPNVEAVENKKGAIVGYRWIGLRVPDVPVKTMNPGFFQPVLYKLSESQRVWKDEG